MAWDMTEQNSRPGPGALTGEALDALLGEHQLGVLATVKRSGHPHLTTMLYRWNPRERTVLFSTTADRAKVRHLERNPKATLHVSSADQLSFAVAEGEAELTDITRHPGDAVGRETLDLLTPYTEGTENGDGDGERDRNADADGNGDADGSGHGDAEALLTQLVAERRLLIRLHVTRLYGTALSAENGHG